MGSLAVSITSRPWTVPMPQRAPAPWIFLSYIPRAASGAISRKGAPRSSTPSSRSCTVSLPSWALRARALSERLLRAMSSSSRSLPTSSSMWA